MTFYQWLCEQQHQEDTTIRGFVYEVTADRKRPGDTRDPHVWIKYLINKLETDGFRTVDISRSAFKTIKLFIDAWNAWSGEQWVVHKLCVALFQGNGSDCAFCKLDDCLVLTKETL